MSCMYLPAHINRGGAGHLFNALAVVGREGEVLLETTEEGEHGCVYAGQNVCLCVSMRE